jgi:hypothetical protein
MSTTFCTSIPKEKVEKIREKMEKADRGEQKTQSITSFSPFCGAFRRRLVLRDIPPEGWCRRWMGEGLSAFRYIPQGLVHRHNSSCEEIPAGKYLQARCAESRLSALGLCRSVPLR